MDMDCYTVSSVESWEPSDLKAAGPPKEKEQTLSLSLYIYSLIPIPSSWKELVLQGRATLQASSSNDDDNNVVFSRVFFLLLFILYLFILRLPMMILVVRVGPEGGVLQPFCLLWVCHRWLLQNSTSTLVKSIFGLGLGFYNIHIHMYKLPSLVFSFPSHNQIVWWCHAWKKIKCAIICYLLETLNIIIKREIIYNYFLL